MATSIISPISSYEQIVFESFPDATESLGGIYNRHLTLLCQLEALAHTGAPVSSDKIAELYQYALSMGMDFAKLLPDD